MAFSKSDYANLYYGNTPRPKIKASYYKLEDMTGREIVSGKYQLCLHVQNSIPKPHLTKILPVYE